MTPRSPYGTPISSEVTEQRINALLDSIQDLRTRLSAAIEERNLLEQERDMARRERDELDAHCARLDYRLKIAHGEGEHR